MISIFANFECMCFSIEWSFGIEPKRSGRWIDDNFLDPEYMFGPRVIDEFPVNSTLHFVDAMYVINCHHAAQDFYNPAHLLHGIGKLFVAATWYYHNKTMPSDEADRTTTTNIPADPLIVYHACPDVDRWAWASWVEKIVWDYAYSRSFVSVTWENRNYQRLVIPVHALFDGVLQEVRDPNEVIFCGKTVQSDSRALWRYYLGENAEYPVKEWKKNVETVVFPRSQGVQDADREKQRKACEKKTLRVAIWQRSDQGEQTNLWLYRNIPEIRELVKDFTYIPLKIISATGDTPPAVQALNFRNAFDVLIAPFGAHLTNAVFGRFDEIVVIQASPVFLGAAYRDQKEFAKRFIESYGHLTWNNPELEALRPNCSGDVFVPECNLPFRSADVVANITKLESALTEAVEAICS